jgi:hypothetical protein
MDKAVLETKAFGGPCLDTWRALRLYGEQPLIRDAAVGPDWTPLALPGTKENVWYNSIALKVPEVMYESMEKERKEREEEAVLKMKREVLAKEQARKESSISGTRSQQEGTGLETIEEETPKLEPTPTEGQSEIVPAEEAQAQPPGGPNLLERTETSTGVRIEVPEKLGFENVGQKPESR